MRLKTLSGILVLLFKDFIESSELEHGKCSNSKNNRVLLTQIKETNMFLRSDQLTSVALITQNNSLTLTFFLTKSRSTLDTWNSTSLERRDRLTLTQRNINIYLLFRQTKVYFKVRALPPNQNTCTRNERECQWIFPLCLHCQCKARKCPDSNLRTEKLKM